MKENILNHVVEIRIDSLIELLSLPLATEFGQDETLTLEQTTFIENHLDTILNGSVSEPIFGHEVGGVEEHEINWAKDYLLSYFSKKL